MSDGKPKSHVMSGVIIVVMVLALGIALFMAGRDSVEPKAAPGANPPDVQALFDRLTPLTQRAGAPWFRAGVEIHLYPNWARIIVKTEAGDEYHGEGRDLQTAVDHMLGASDAMRRALDGWSH